MKKIAILSIIILSFFAVSFAFAAQQPEMNVYVADINVGETAHVQIILPVDVIGEVIVSVNNQNYTAKVVDGNATVDLKDLKEGNYTLNVTCPENGNYSKISKNVSLSVINNTPVVPENKTPENNTPENNTPENKTPVVPENNTPVNPQNNTPANAGGEPVNTQNVTPVAPTNITNDTNTTNKTNNTNNTVPAKQVDNNPKQVEKPKAETPKYYLILQKTGLPIAILILVAIAIIFGAVYLRKK